MIAAATGRIIASVRSDADPALGEGDCEEISGALLNQPTNALSSVAFVVCGTWLLARLRSLDGGQRRTAGAYGALVLANGLGSLAYHGPQFAGAEILHDLPAMGLLVMGVGVPLMRWRSGRTPLPGYSWSRMLAIGVVSAIAGSAYFLGRSSGPLCDPASWAQPHGLWHLGAAILMGLWSVVLWPGRGDEGG
jgi:hypothetical protein